MNQILEFIPTIDFSTTAEPGDISFFETNIRYLGGLLSGESERKSSWSFAPFRQRLQTC